MAHYSLVTRTRVLAAKIEGTPGTLEALTATEAAWNVFDTKIQQRTPMEARLKQGSFAQLPSVPGGRIGEVMFSMELYGGSAAPTWATVFLAACGLGITGGAYVVDKRPPEATGSTAKTISIGVYENGIVKKLAGCMGNVVFHFVAGMIVRAEFTFRGVWQAPSDVAILAPTYPTDSPLRFVSSTFTIGSWNPTLQELTLDVGNEVYLREDASKASGFSSAVIGNRLPKLTINPEEDILATKNIWSEWLANTEAALSFTAAAGSDDVTVTESKLQFIDPQEADREGLQVNEIACELHADDLTLTFT